MWAQDTWAAGHLPLPASGLAEHSPGSQEKEFPVQELKARALDSAQLLLGWRHWKLSWLVRSFRICVTFYKQSEKELDSTVSTPSSLDLTPEDTPRLSLLTFKEKLPSTRAEPHCLEC